MVGQGGAGRLYDPLVDESDVRSSMPSLSFDIWRPSDGSLHLDSCFPQLSEDVEALLEALRDPLHWHSIAPDLSTRVQRSLCVSPPSVF